MGQKPPLCEGFANFAIAPGPGGTGQVAFSDTSIASRATETVVGIRAERTC